MVKNKTLLIIKFLIGVYLIQVLLPLGIIISVFIVKLDQRSIIDNYAKNKHLFVDIEMDTDEFSKLVITNDEFIYKHQLYDLKSVKRGVDKVILTAISDLCEKKIKLANGDIVRKTTKNASRLLKSYQLEFIHNYRIERLFILSECSKKEFSLFKLNYPETPYLKVVKPPPDYTLSAI